jgi:conjugative transfer pilus assembly protein TraH
MKQYGEMQSLQATAQQTNRLNIDSCEAAKRLVNAALPNTWTPGRQNTAKNFEVNANIFENITDAWTNVTNKEGQANKTADDVAKAEPEIKDQLPSGNIVWKALKKLNGVDVDDWHGNF